MTAEGVAKENSTSSAAGSGATALFPCLVYYPSNNNYSLIWVPMDGSNPAISQAAAAAGASFQFPMVRRRRRRRRRESGGRGGGRG